MINKDMKVTFSLSMVLILTSLISFAQDSYAIKNVSVITMSKEEVLPDQTVLVEKGIIKTISPAAKTKLSKGIKVIDGKGKFLIPGLFDMHAHFFYEQGDHINTNETELKLICRRGRCRDRRVRQPPRARRPRRLAGNPPMLRCWCRDRRLDVPVEPVFPSDAL